jgi:phage shock protein E
MLRTIVLSLLVAAGCTASSAPPVATHDKDPAAARALIAAGATVLDVRTPDEFAQGHVPSAINIPVDALPGQLAEVGTLTHGDHNAPVVVYCASGARAATAARALTSAGYTHVVNGGGIDALE